MGQALIGQDIGPRLTKALGLPGKCRSFELRVAVNEVVSVRCEYFPSGDPQEIVAALAEYEVVRRLPAEPKAEAHPAAAMGFDAWMRQRTEEAHHAFMDRTGRVYWRSKLTGKAWTKEEFDAARAARVAAFDAGCVPAAPKAK